MSKLLRKMASNRALIESKFLEELLEWDKLNTSKYLISLKEGRFKDLAFIFYFINVIEGKIPFYVKGGIIQYYYLEDNARPTRDLDIITYLDIDTFKVRLDELLSNIKDDFTYRISYFDKTEKNKYYFYDVFNIEIEVSYLGEVIHKLLLDGVSSDIYNQIEVCTYKGISGFKGVPIEYIAAEKIMALSNELARPVKHLVDVYSLSKIELDKKLLKKYLDLILKNDNEVRLKYELNILDSKYLVREDKKFTGNYLLACLHAGYNITMDEMKKRVNDWLKNL